MEVRDVVQKAMVKVTPKKKKCKQTRSSPSVYSIIKGHMCKVGKNVDMSSQAQGEPQPTVTWDKVRSQLKVPQC